MLKIWDRKESINGVPADEYLAGNPLIHEGDEIILEYNSIGRIKQIINATEQRVNLNLDSSLDAIQVAETLLKSSEINNNSTTLESRVADLESYVLEKSQSEIN